jgi:hypothetical protein
VTAGDTFKQPDGKVVELEPLRIGKASYFEDAQGFTVVRIPIGYEYAMPAEDGSLKPSGIELRSMDPTMSALPVRLTPTPEFLEKRRKVSPAGLAPPSPLPVEIKLPDGSVVRLKFKGSGAYAWYEDEHGYSVVTTPERFEYALRGPTGQLIPCGILAGSMNPADAGLKPGIRPASSAP